jgi:alpha-1,6-mannosyltransferase
VHLIDLTIFYAPESGGVKTYLKAKADWIAKHTPLRHTIIAPGWESNASYVTVPGVPIPFSNGHKLPLSINATAKTITRLQPDCIEVEDPYQFAWAALRVGRELSVPIVAYYHSDLPRLIRQRLGSLAEQAAYQYVKRLYSQFDLVLTPSKYIEHYLNQMGIIRTRYQPLGVDTTTFSPIRRDQHLRKQLGLQEETRLLVYAGRFSREKNLLQLIRAVEQLGSPYHLLMVGDGCKLPASPYITHIPFQHDPTILATILASCDVMVHTGGQETFGLIVLEAMSCGIPVIGMASGGVAELIPEDCGMLVKHGDVSALKNGINDLYECDLQQFGSHARKLVLEKHDWNKVMPQFMGQYASLFGKGSEGDALSHLSDEETPYAYD